MPDTQIMIATSDATVTVGGVEVKVRKDSSTAFATDQIVLDNPDLWTGVEAHYEDDTDPDETIEAEDTAEAHTVSTGDVTSLTTDAVPVDESKPDAKDVRAWAKDNGIDVPARGPIPDAFIERYKADQGTSDGG